MSRAFTRESDDDQAPLPECALSTHPNLVTPEGPVSWVSPLAQALLGHAVGDAVRFQERELEILGIEP
jgi:Transcription elongation factor, GreA/GreB, C-term